MAFMNGRNTVLLGIGSVILLGVGSRELFYKINENNNDRSITFEGIGLGDSRTTIKYTDVSVYESEALRESMKKSYPDLVQLGKLTSYYEILEGAFNLNIEGKGILESKIIADEIINNSGLKIK
ncbi:MAG TPA: hypothetical protein VJH92_00690 [Candidatus Nanoarchaeia archaeon]|nr:hypothetical protein [Candidatus Nanoarchaeia archaeon]